MGKIILPAVASLILIARPAFAADEAIDDRILEFFTWLSLLADEPTRRLVKWLAASSLSLISLVGALIAVLAAIKFTSMAWAEVTRRGRSWMAPAFEGWLKSGSADLPAEIRGLQWPATHILQYALVHRSFGTRGAELTRIAEAYDALGFVDADLRRTRSWLWWRRAEGARCLGQMKSRRATPRLIELLDDRAVEVRLVTAWALGRIGDVESIDRSLASLVSSSRLAGMRLSSTVFELGLKAVPPLLRSLEHADPAVRLLGVHLLGELRSELALDRIRELSASDPDKEVRVAAFKAMGTIGLSSAAPHLLDGLFDPMWEIRAQAARGLGLTGGPDAVPALRTALRDPKWWVRRNAGEALTKLGADGRGALLEAWEQDPESEPGLMAAQWLDELGSLPTTR